jgi:transcriptional regulator with XRE-family HTH domain
MTMATDYSTPEHEAAPGEDLDFQALLRRVLDDKGWSQSDLARRSGIRVGTINTWVNGTRGKPGGENIRKLAAATGVSVETWAKAVGKKVPAPLDDKAEAYILHLWRTMDPTEQRVITRTMEAIAQDREHL